MLDYRKSYCLPGGYVIKSDFDFRNVNQSFSKIAQLDVNCAILETQRSSIESQ